MKLSFSSLICFVFAISFAHAQNLPSPQFNNITVNGILGNPNFSNSPTIPTPSNTDISNKAANTKFVNNLVSVETSRAIGAETTLTTNVNNALSIANTAQTTATTAQSNAVAAQGTATAAQSTANSAQSAIAGLGTAAQQNVSAFMQPSNNLSELTNTSIARSYLDVSATVNTTSALSTVVGASGEVIRKTGYYAAGDMPGADYAWQSASCTTLDNGSCFTASPSGSWLILPGQKYDARQWGCVPGGGMQPDQAGCLQLFVNYEGTITSGSQSQSYVDFGGQTWVDNSGLQAVSNEVWDNGLLLATSSSGYSVTNGMINVGTTAGVSVSNFGTAHSLVIDAGAKAGIAGIEAFINASEGNITFGGQIYHWYSLQPPETATMLVAGNITSLQSGGGIYNTGKIDFLSAYKIEQWKSTDIGAANSSLLNTGYGIVESAVGDNTYLGGTVQGGYRPFFIENGSGVIRSIGVHAFTAWENNVSQLYGYISGTTLTIVPNPGSFISHASNYGCIPLNQTITGGPDGSGNSISTGTVATVLPSAAYQGICGQAGTYTVNNSQTFGSASAPVAILSQSPVLYPSVDYDEYGNNFLLSDCYADSGELDVHATTINPNPGATVVGCTGLPTAAVALRAWVVLISDMPKANVGAFNLGLDNYFGHGYNYDAMITEGTGNSWNQLQGATVQYWLGLGNQSKWASTDLDFFNTSPNNYVAARFATSSTSGSVIEYADTNTTGNHGPFAGALGNSFQFGGASATNGQTLTASTSLFSIPISISATGGEAISNGNSAKPLTLSSTGTNACESLSDVATTSAPLICSSGNNLLEEAGGLGTAFTLAAQGATFAKSITVGSNGIFGDSLSSAITTVGNQTLSAAILVNGPGSIINRSGPTAAFTDTIPNATSLIAALNGGIANNSFTVRYNNYSAYMMTFTLGTGDTPSGIMSVSANSTTDFLFQITGAGAVTISNIGPILPSNAIACSQLPALTGDITSSAGSCATTLATVATPGTGLPTINAKGLSTSVRPLAIADLPTSIPNANLANYSITLFGTTLNLGSTVTTLSSGTINQFIAGGSGSFASWTTTSPVFSVASATLTDSSGSGTIANRASATFSVPTFAATNTEVINNADTVYISAPIAGANVTLTNPYSLYSAGNSYFGGTITTGNNVVSGGNITGVNGTLSGTLSAGYGAFSASSTAQRVILSGATVVSTNGLYVFAINSVGFSTNTTYAGDIDAGQHFRIGGSGTPTIATNACGATTQGSIAAGGNDQSFELTIGTAGVTTCTVTFASAFTTVPRGVQLTSANATAANTGLTLDYVSSVSTTQIVIVGSALAGASYYVQVQ
jgi:hypothetical protein